MHQTGYLYGMWKIDFLSISRKIGEQRLRVDCIFGKAAFSLSPPLSPPPHLPSAAAIRDGRTSEGDRLRGRRHSSRGTRAEINLAIDKGTRPAKKKEKIRGRSDTLNAAGERDFAGGY